MDLLKDTQKVKYLWSYKLWQSLGFQKHISQDHDAWDYVFFQLHLEFIPKTEYTVQGLGFWW